MPQKRQRDYAKERHWRKVIAAWKVSALTGAEYCRQHDITYTQFVTLRIIWQRFSNYLAISGGA
jgi:hypothetical protein